MGAHIAAGEFLFQSLDVAGPVADVDPVGELAFEFGEQCGEHFCGVADDGDVDGPDFADFGGINVSVDDLGVGGEGFGLAGDPVVKASADGNEQVGSPNAMRVVTTGMPVWLANSNSWGAALALMTPPPM